MTTKKVLIAGSTLLADVFNTVSDALRLVSNSNSKNVLIRAYTYEDIDNMFSQGGGKQEKINRYIKEDADYVIFVLEEELGGITKKEFDIAWETFMSQDRPGIYVYHRPAQIISPEIQEVINKINDCHQYYTKYSNLEILKLRVQVDFQKLINKLDIEGADNLPTSSNDANIQPYKIRVNRPCHLLIDGKELAILEEQMLTDIPLSAGVHQRKVVAIDDSSIFHEATINISENPNIDIITLFTIGLDESRRKALPSLSFQVGDFMYDALKDGSGVTLSQYLNKNAIEVEIPRQILYNNYLHHVESIGDNAFRDCILLKSITIPSSVMNIGTEVFYNCPALEHIEVDKNNSTYDSRDNCNAIIRTAAKALIAGCQNTIIPNGVTKIRSFAFSHCHTLTSISIPNSVTSIGVGAFMGCKSLTSITIPNSVILIGISAFAYCSNLKTITIGDGVKVIDDGAFENCSSLESIILPIGISRIGRKIVNGCSSLKSITVPRFATEIANYDFSENIKVKWYDPQSNTLPKLNRTKKLLLSTLVALAVLLLVAVSSIAIARKTLRYEYDYSQNTATVVAKKHFFCCKGKITVPFSIKHRGKLFFVDSIGDYAFKGCKDLTAIYLPKSLESIGEHAFDDCDDLKHITIPEYVKNIGDGAFFGCSNLTSVDIPNSAKCIGDFAFCCTGLTSIDMPKSVIAIGVYAFSSCHDLTSVTIPDSVTTIEEGVFNGCERLSSVIIPYGVTTIGEEAFGQCKNLIAVNMPNSVTEIASKAFNGCTSLLHVPLSNNLLIIGDCAFEGCSSLASVTIPNTVTNIERFAFSGCSGLTSITIPYSVTSIGNGAFLGCDELKSIRIPKSITEIGVGAIPSHTKVIRE